MPQVVKIHHCSVAEFRHHVEPNSIDAIVTDPPYSASFLYVYDDLAEFAFYTLKEGGSLLCMTGQSFLPTVIEKLSRKLLYHWCAAYLTPRLASPRMLKRVNNFWKPILWFTKGKYKGNWIGDVCKSEDSDKTWHKHGQSESGIKDILERWTKTGEIVCDPFLGGGVVALVASRMGRRFIGCDNDPDAVAKSLERLAQPVTVQIDKPVSEVMKEMRMEGKKYREIAAHLNEMGKRTQRGLKYTAQNVAYLLEEKSPADSLPAEAAQLTSP